MIGSSNQSMVKHEIGNPGHDGRRVDGDININININIRL